METSRGVEQKGVLEKGGGCCLFLNVPCSKYVLQMSKIILV